MSWLILFPLAAVLIGVAFAIAYYFCRKLLTVIAGLLWIVYGIYESLMHARVLCSGECNIRVDLLVIYPLLLLATVVGIVSASRKSRL